MPAQTRWRDVSILLLAGIIVALQIGKAAIAAPILIQELTLTLVAASWIIGAYGMLGAVGGLPAGIATSLFSARQTLLAGLLTAGVGSLLGACVESGALMIATRAVESCGFLAVVLTIPRLLRAVTAPKNIDAVLAIWGAYMPTGSAIMMLAGPHLLAFGWQALWLINGALVLGFALVIWRRDFQEPAVGENAAQALLPNIRAVLGAPGPILLALVFGIYTFQYMAVAGLLPTLLVERAGLSISAAGLISALSVTANAVGNMSAGVLLRLGVPTWSIAAAAFAFVGVASFGVFSDAIPVAGIAALAALSLGLTGLIPGSIFAAAPKLAPTSALLAIALGLINQASNLGSLFGPAAMALVVERLSWNRAPLLFVGVALAGVTAALMLRSAMRRAPPLTTP